MKLLNFTKTQSKQKRASTALKNKKYLIYYPNIQIPTIPTSTTLATGHFQNLKFNNNPLKTYFYWILFVYFLACFHTLDNNH